MQLVFTKTGEDNVNEIFASLRGTTFQNVQSEKDDEYDIDSEPDEEESVMIQSQIEERKVGDDAMIMSQIS